MIGYDELQREREEDEVLEILADNDFLYGHELRVVRRALASGQGNLSRAGRRVLDRVRERLIRKRCDECERVLSATGRIPDLDEDGLCPHNGGTG